jgi:hypothetical protein
MDLTLYSLILKAVISLGFALYKQHSRVTKLQTLKKVKKSKQTSKYPTRL